MTNSVAALEQLRRPNLLVRAAQIGAPDYKRTRLSRQKDDADISEACSGRWTLFKSLLTEEAALDSDRRIGAATYSASKHIEVLTALIVEAEILDI